MKIVSSMGARMQESKLFDTCAVARKADTTKKRDVAQSDFMLLA